MRYVVLKICRVSISEDVCTQNVFPTPYVLLYSVSRPPHLITTCSRRTLTHRARTQHAKATWNEASMRRPSRTFAHSPTPRMPTTSLA